jgi:hypothetical protein
VAFRNDILRGVRLFLIAFAAVLIGVWVYRMVRAPSDVQGAEPTAPATYEAAQPYSRSSSNQRPMRLLLTPILPRRMALWFLLLRRWVGHTLPSG